MIYVRELLQEKDCKVRTIEENETALEAGLLMTEWHVGALIVLQGGEFSGIISERDILSRVIADHRDPSNTLVSEIMTRECQTCLPDDPLETVRADMQRFHIRHIPVLENTRVKGIISMRDVMEATLRESREDLAKLQNYVYGPACGG